MQKKEIKIYLDIIYENSFLKKTFYIQKKMLLLCIKHLCSYIKLPKCLYEIEVCTMIASKNYIKKLNKQFLGKNKETNVLSFPNNTINPVTFSPVNNVKNLYLGDIAMSPEVMQKEAKMLDILLHERLYHMFIHSVLHLLGYTHNNDEEEMHMKNIEYRIINNINLCPKKIVLSTYK